MRLSCSILKYFNNTYKLPGLVRYDNLSCILDFGVIDGDNIYTRQESGNVKNAFIAVNDQGLDMCPDKDYGCLPWPESNGLEPVFKLISVICYLN